MLSYRMLCKIENRMLQLAAETNGDYVWDGEEWHLMNEDWISSARALPEKDVGGKVDSGWKEYLPSYI